MKEVYRIMNYQYLGEKEVVDAGFMNAKKCVTKLREYEQKITSGALQFGRLLDHQEQTEEEALKIPAGIMAALAAPKLVRSDPRVLSLIGTGPVNYCALLCFLELFPSVDTIKLKGSSLNSRSAQNIRDYLQEDYPQVRRTIICETLEEACRGADILLEAQGRDTIRENRFGFDWMKRGATVVSMGHFVVEDRQGFRGMKLVTDQYDLYDKYMDEFVAQGPMGEDGMKREWGVMGMHFVHLVKCHGMDRENVLDVAAIINGTEQGRTSEEETVMCGLGINLI